MRHHIRVPGAQNRERVSFDSEVRIGDILKSSDGASKFIIKTKADLAYIRGKIIKDLLAEVNLPGTKHLDLDKHSEEVVFIDLLDQLIKQCSGLGIAESVYSPALIYFSERGIGHEN